VDVRLTEGEPPASEPTGAYDRFLSNFVFDLLSFEDIAAVLAETHRMLRPNALLGLSSLTIGFTAASRALGWFLTMVHSLQPVIVGGCRPLELSELLAQDLVHHERVAPLGLALEAVIAAPKENAAV
jgi:hypothetical protein